MRPVIRIVFGLAIILTTGALSPEQSSSFRSVPEFFLRFTFFCGVCLFATGTDRLGDSDIRNQD